MNKERENIILQLTVRLGNGKSPIGTGVLYYDNSLNEKIYVLTAAHCLYSDRDGYTNPYETICIDIYNPYKYRAL